ncbi:17779_t:CDS:2, partial [Dentiscutata erythropus]
MPDSPDSLKNFNDKTQETNIIGTFPGFQPISDNCMTRGGMAASNSSNSIFCVVDIPPMENQQIIQDLIDYLRQTYYQANQPSLGRVYDIKKYEVVALGFTLVKPSSLAETNVSKPTSLNNQIVITR